MTRFLITLCFLSLIASAPATAQQPGDWPHSVWKKGTHGKAVRKAKPKARVRHHKRKKHVRTDRLDTRRIRTGSIPRGATPQPEKCMPSVSVVGDQSPSTNGAKAQAEKAWQQQVRFRNGELYADPRYATTITYRCVDSSIRNIANRATEALGINSQFKRCSMTAIPCRAPLQRENIQ
jgi:hypothetical protein